MQISIMAAPVMCSHRLKMPTGNLVINRRDSWIAKRKESARQGVYFSCLDMKSRKFIGLDVYYRLKIKNVAPKISRFLQRLFQIFP